MAEKDTGKESTKENVARTTSSTSTMTTDTAAMGTYTDSGTPDPMTTLRGSGMGVSHDMLNPAFAAPKDEGHEKNLKAAQEAAKKER